RRPPLGWHLFQRRLELLARLTPHALRGSGRLAPRAGPHRAGDPHGARPRRLLSPLLPRRQVRRLFRRDGPLPALAAPRSPRRVGGRPGAAGSAGAAQLATRRRRAPVWRPGVPGTAPDPRRPVERFPGRAYPSPDPLAPALAAGPAPRRPHGRGGA